MMARVFIFFILFILVFSGAAISGRGVQTPYVVVISLDGFRWDYLDRGITPNIDALAARGVRALTFKPAFPSKTFPNHYTQVTGLYPQNHGIINNKFFDPFNGLTYRVGDTLVVRDDRWYMGETIWSWAGRQGVKSASFFWPGSETRLAYKHPTYFKHYDGGISHEQRIDGIIQWLSLPEADRPHLLFLYFSDTDDSGHEFGPRSEQLNAAVALVDRKIGLLLKRLEAIDMEQKVNLVVVSDHGMTALKRNGLIALSNIIDLHQVRLSGYGPIVQLFFNVGADRTALMKQLHAHEKLGYSAYLKDDMPEHFHYRHNGLIGDVILLADLGNRFIGDAADMDRALQNLPSGDHGYDNEALDMHGIFVAAGPAFKRNYRTGTLRNIDLFPLLCKILNISQKADIDGRLSRIEYILK